MPAQIEAQEFEELLAQDPDAVKPLLTTDGPVPVWRDGQPIARVGWYRKDLNAVPAAYVLQQRTIEFPERASEEDRKRIREEERLDWSALETRMRSLLLVAIDKAGWASTDPRRFKYEASATHQEILAGALRAEDPREHVFCYFREIDDVPTDGSAGAYRDIPGGAVDADAQERLRALKADLVELLPPEHAHRYRAAWTKGSPEYDRRDLCDDVERDLKAIIDREIASFKQKPALEHDRDAHREFAEERCRHFVGRQDALERIKSYLADPKANRPLIVHGVSGCGKTALIAKAVLDLTQSAMGNPQQAIVSRFIGTTPGSSDLRTLLGDLCRELDVAEIPQDMNDLVRAFRGQLSTEQSDSGQEGAKQPPPDQRSIVLFLDALDQLNPTDNARMLYWMPRELKPNVKLVVSVLKSENEGGDHTRREDPYDLARRIWPESMIEIGPLDEASAAGLLNAWLQEAGRTLQADQTAEVLGKFAECPLPLYLKLASEEARRWKSWEGVPEPLKGTVEGILEQLLARLERPENHGLTLVSRSLGYSNCSKKPFVATSTSSPVTPPRSSSACGTLAGGMTAQRRRSTTKCPKTGGCPRGRPGRRPVRSCAIYWRAGARERSTTHAPSFCCAVCGLRQSNLAPLWRRSSMGIKARSMVWLSLQTADVSSVDPMTERCVFGTSRAARSWLSSAGARSGGRAWPFPPTANTWPAGLPMRCVFGMSPIA